MDFSRHSKKTLYVVAGFYVLVGFVLAIASVVSGDRLGTFLGFLIISGALVAAAMLRAIMRIGQQADELAHTLKEIRHALVHAEDSVRQQIREVKEAAGVRVVDLSTFGSGDPSVLTAATLDRDAYPRLVMTMAESASADTASGNDNSIHPESADLGEPAQHPNGPATKNLLRQWKIAVRDGDLVACRVVLSTLIDVATPAELAPLEAQFTALEHRVDGGLRRAFSAHVRNRDFAGALAVGQQIVELLPDSTVRKDFERVKPQLERRITAGAARFASQSSS